MTGDEDHDESDEMHWAIPENIHPPWTTLNSAPKNFRISKKDNCSFGRIPEPADSKSWGIPEFRKTLNGFPGIPVKIYKILGKGPVKLIQRVKIAQSFLQSVSNLFHFIILSLPM